MREFLGKFWHHTLKVPYRLAIHERRRTRKARTTLVFLHGVGSSGKAWQSVIDQLAAEQVNVVVFDLLGFGGSPRPRWATYDAATQARAVARTLQVWRRTEKIILVGHSMGALVAIECARRYPKAFQALVLASPPLYDDKTGRYLPDRDTQLRALYTRATKYPETLIAASKVAKKYGLIGHAFDITNETIDEYISALKGAIISQTSLNDIRELTLPITITYGRVDPFVIGARFKNLAKTMENVRVVSFVGGHEVEGRYVELLVQEITRRIR